MKNFTLPAFVALSLLSFACGKDDDNNDGQTIEEIPTQFAGTFRTDCLPNSQLNLSHATRELKISNVGDFDKKEVYYSDACASAPSLVYKVVGTVQNKGKLPEDQTLDMLNFSVNEAYITAGSEDVVNVLNTTRFCGKNDWVLNQETSIAGLNCQNFAISKGEVIQDVVEDQDGTLYFGKKFALLLNETGERPTEVDMDVPYHKQ